MTPFVQSFGDESPEYGETNIDIAAFDIGFFQGEVWLFDNPDPTQATLTDQLTVTAWVEGAPGVITVNMPATPNVGAGAAYIGIRTFDGDWSTPAFPYQVTVVDPGSLAVVGTLNDAKYAGLNVALSNPGLSLAEMELDYINGLFSGDIGTIQDAWHAYWDFDEQPPGHFNDRAYDWLGSLGHNQLSYNDRWASYWIEVSES